ncbi:hypothetical protein CLAIMM_09627 [Cladophialophora immunda]|nr:hypothetical protein CLAIMM_09627 [Cladophialophora immunda]
MNVSHLATPSPRPMSTLIEMILNTGNHEHEKGDQTSSSKFLAAQQSWEFDRYWKERSTRSLLLNLTFTWIDFSHKITL